MSQRLFQSSHHDIVQHCGPDPKIVSDDPETLRGNPIPREIKLQCNLVIELAVHSVRQHMDGVINSELHPDIFTAIQDPGMLQAEIRQSMTEALQNATHYGHEGDVKKVISVDWWIQGDDDPLRDTFEMWIGDAGKGGVREFTHDEAIARSMDGHQGGFGTLLIKGLADEYTHGMREIYRILPNPDILIIPRHIITLRRRLFAKKPKPE